MVDDWDTLQRAKVAGLPFDSRLCAEAAFVGDLDWLQWLVVHHCPWSSWTVYNAAAGGHVPVLQWLLLECQPPCPCDWARLWSVAVGKENLDLLKWLLTFTPLRYHVDPWEHVIAIGCLDLVKWLHAHRYAWEETSTRYCYMAARNGHLEILQWLRAQGCPWNVNEIYNVADKNQEWLILHWVVTQYPGSFRKTYDVDDQRYYLQRQELLASGYNVKWERHLYRWLDAVTETSQDVLKVLLCPDLVALVQRYC